MQNSAQSADSSPLTQRHRSLKVESVFSRSWVTRPGTSKAPATVPFVTRYRPGSSMRSTKIAPSWPPLFINMMTFEKIQLAQRKIRQKALRRDLKKAAAKVKHFEDEVALASKEVDAAKERLVLLLEKLNSTETLWRRLRTADSFIIAHQRRITEAYARKDRAWSMLMRANESVIALCGLQHENLLRILHWKRELGRYK